MVGRGLVEGLVHLHGGRLARSLARPSDADVERPQLRREPRHRRDPLLLSLRRLPWSALGTPSATALA
eukprot:8299182-Alexandrium_andersonii.AAC.1